MDSSPGELPGPQAGRLCEKCPLYIYIYIYFFKVYLRNRQKACLESQEIDRSRKVKNSKSP